MPACHTDADASGGEQPETIPLDDAIELADHARLVERLQKLRDAVAEAPDHYTAEVWPDSRVTMVVVSSSQDWTRGGELGLAYFRVMLGAAGGLRMAKYRDTFSGYECDYADGYRVGYALRRVCDKIRAAR